MSAFRDMVVSETELRALVGSPSELAVRKQVDRLDAHCRALIARAPVVLVATADAAGRCDVSPKGDAAGFALVLDDHRLALPDRPGNRRLDGMRNILANPRVGLLFVIPGLEETLRVNGRACVTRDPELLARMAARDRVPELAIGVEVEEVFVHCAKAFKRSHLWEPEQWPDRAGLPSIAQVLLDQARPENATVADVEATLRESYTRRLY